MNNLERFYRKAGDASKNQLLYTKAVASCGPYNPLPLAFMGEAPGANEVAQGLPFVGEAGQMLRGLCSGAEVYLPGCWLCNTIDRRPENNDIQTENAQSLLVLQASEFWREVTYLVREKKITTFVALGNTPIKAFGIEGKISAVRGSVYPISLELKGLCPPEQTPDFIVIPTYHPAYIVRNRWTTGKGGATEALLAIEDIKKAKLFSEEGYKPVIENFNLNPTADQVVDFIESGLKKKDLFGFDVETDGDHTDGRIWLLGLAKNDTDALVIPFWVHNPVTGAIERAYADREWLRIRTAIQRLLLNGRLMAQNAAYDLLRLRAEGFKLDFTKLEHDTMLLSHRVNPENFHNLGHIVSLYGRTTFWKDMDWKVPIHKRDQVEFRTYNARDVVVLHQVLPGLYKGLQKLGPLAVKAYHERAIPMVEAIVEMEYNGVGFAEHRLDAWQAYCAEQVSRTATELSTLTGVPVDRKFTSIAVQQLYFFGIKPTLKLKAAHETLNKPRAKQSSKDEAAQFIAFVESTRQPWPGIANWGGRKGKSGRLSISKKNRPELSAFAIKRKEYLNKLIRQSADHRLEIAQIDHFLKVLAAYDNYVRAVKIASTYATIPTLSDGRVHGHFNQAGTATSRLAMSRPNLQNQPAKGWAAQINQLYVASPGHVLISADYSNIEFVILAYLSGEPGFIKIVEEQLNIHDINTRLLFGDMGILEATHPKWGPARRAAKIFQFGKIQYCGSNHEIHRNICAEVPELGLTMAQFERATETYMGHNPVFASWLEGAKREARETRLARTPFGFVRTLMGNISDLEKQGANTPVQGGAAELIADAMVRLLRSPLYKKLGVKLLLQVHDELVIEVPVANANLATTLLHDTMTVPVTIEGRTFTPAVDIEAGFDRYNTVPAKVYLENPTTALAGFEADRIVQFRLDPNVTYIADPQAPELEDDTDILEA